MLNLKSRWIDVTWDEQTLHLRGAWAEGACYVAGRYVPPSSHKGERIVPVAEIARVQVVRPYEVGGNGSVVVRTTDGGQLTFPYGYDQVSAFTDLVVSISQSVAKRR